MLGGRGELCKERGTAVGLECDGWTTGWRGRKGGKGAAGAWCSRGAELAGTAGWQARCDTATVSCTHPLSC